MFNILIVDDEPFVREGLKVIIDWEQYGFSICGEAENGKKAADIIQKHKPELVITDIKMPVISGLELIKHVNFDLKLNVKFIILSGFNDFEFARQAIRYNVVDYILKPVDSNQLTQLLEQIRETLNHEYGKNENEQPGGIIEEIKRLVKTNYREEITLKDIAKVKFMHPVYLGQLFKKSTGLFFNDYLHQYRIEEAKRKLWKTDKKIYYIAVEVGYEQADYFVAKFKKIVGMTPSEYRKRFKEFR